MTPEAFGEWLGLVKQFRDLGGNTDRLSEINPSLPQLRDMLAGMKELHGISMKIAKQFFQRDCK